MAPDNEGGTPLDWQKHEAEILDLFVTQDRTLKEVMKYMKEKHGFLATARQYKYRFNRLKKVTEDEWAYVYDECRRRAGLGKQTDVYLHGRLLAPERVKRGIRRVLKKGSRSSSSSNRRHNDAGRISFRTRNPSPASMAGQLLAQVPAPVDNRAPSQPMPDSQPAPAPQDQVPENDFSAQLMVLPDYLFEAFDVLPGQRVTELDAFGMDIAADTSSVTADRPVPTMGQEWAVIDASSEFVNNYRALPRARSSHQSPSPEGVFSPFREFESFDLFDTWYHGYGLLKDLPYFQVLHIAECLGHQFSRQTSSRRSRGLTPMPTKASSSGFLIVARGAFPNASDSMEELVSTANVARVAFEVQQLVPERYEGDLSQSLGRILDPTLPTCSTLPWLLSVTAFFAYNNGILESQMDAFLEWIIDQGHIESLGLFMTIRTPAVQAFAEVLLESAIRVKNIQLLETLLRCGVKLDSKLNDIARVVGDISLTTRVLFDVDPASFTEDTKASLLHHFVGKGHFDLAQSLLGKGVSVDAVYEKETALHSAVGRGDIKAVTFLLEAGAGMDLYNYGYAVLNTTALGYAVFRNKAEIFHILLEHGAKTSATICGIPLIEWAALHRRTYYELLRGKVEPESIGFLLGDLVAAARCGCYALAAYMALYPRDVTTHQLERALEQAVRKDHVDAAITLLQHGVSANGPTLNISLLEIALSEGPNNLTLCTLLLEHGADIGQPEVLQKLARGGPSHLLEAALASNIDVNDRMRALVTAARHNNIISAAVLLRSGVNVETPGLQLSSTPLQEAAKRGNEEMIMFLISKGANVNAPAHPNGGRTALQAALEKAPVEIARLLLHSGADAFAPPALLDGKTALEAICHRVADDSQQEQPCVQLCYKLLDAGATVNRPGGKPSSALHGVIMNEWDEVLSRFLEPQHRAITNYIWSFFKYFHEEEDLWEPYTPTQLAASRRYLNGLTMLLDYGVDVNEAPAYQSGRTALQAAAQLPPSPSKMTIIRLLLDRGANINADPALERGVTALQAAAIAGDLMLAKSFIEQGADVNARPSFKHGRTAIEGAAEHGRLDMVQLLLNAGAEGDVIRGTGFKGAIELAEENGHFAVVNLLKTQQPNL